MQNKRGQEVWRVEGQRYQEDETKETLSQDECPQERCLPRKGLAPACCLSGLGGPSSEPDEMEKDSMYIL